MFFRHQIDEHTSELDVKMNSQLDLIVGVWSESGGTFSEENFGYKVKVFIQKLLRYIR